MKETCSCGASKIYKVEGPLSEPRFERLVELFDEWRKNHHHEIAQEAEADPMIHESGSQNELAYNDQVPNRSVGFGFRETEVFDVAVPRNSFLPRPGFTAF